MVGIGLNIRDFPSASPRLSLRSCNYGAFHVWYPCSLWAAFGLGLNIRYFPSASPRLSLRSCNYGVFHVWYPCSPWATCIDNKHVLQVPLSQGEAVVFVILLDYFDKETTETLWIHNDARCRPDQLTRL